MALPMTIHEARAMQADDVALDDDAVQQAEGEAIEDEEAAATLERSAVEGGKGAAAPGAVVEARAVAEFARQRAGRMRDRADKAAAARRLLALEKVGQDVDALAAEGRAPDAGMAKALKMIADGAAEAARLTEAHNTRTQALIARARELQAEGAAPLGPKATSAHVTLFGSSMTDGHGIQHGNTSVRVVSQPALSEALQTALKGDQEAALERLGHARRLPPPERAERYFLGAGGAVTGVSGDTPFTRQLERQAADGNGRWLDDDEAEAYWRGELHGYQRKAEAQ